MIDCSAYLDAKLAHTSQAMMLCAAALLNAAMIRMPLLAERKLGWLARPPRPSKVLLFFSLAPPSVQTLPAVDFTSPTAAKKMAANYLGSASQALSDAPEPRIRGYRSLKLCIAAFSTNISSAAFFDGLKTNPWLRKCSSQLRARTPRTRQANSIELNSSKSWTRPLARSH